MNKGNWSKIEKMLQELLNEVGNKIDSKINKFIQHYIDHSEYEMAFEILFIELIKINYFPEKRLSEYCEIGVILNLDVETIYDQDFWKNFKKYIRQNLPAGTTSGKGE